MKRYLSLFLAAAVLISCLTITAFADDGREDNANAFNGSFVDMLPALKYSFYKNDVFVKDTDNPIVSLSSDAKGTKYQFSWSPYAAGSILGVNFCLFSGVKPTSVQFMRADGLVNQCTYLYSDGKYHFYSYTNVQAFEYNRISVVANYSADSTTVNFGIINFYAILPDSKPVTNCTYSCSIQYYQNSLSYVRSVKAAENVAIPYSHSFMYESYSNYLAISTLKIDIPASNANCLSLTFTTLGAVNYSSSFSCGVYKDGTLICMLPVELIEGYAGSVQLQSDDKALYYSYTGNIDLRGIDLTGCQLYVKIEAQSWSSDAAEYFKINILDIAYKENVYVVPWYREFYNWITGVMTAGYQSIVDAIKGDSNTEMNEATDQMEGAANDLKESSNAFEQVETPDIDAGALTGDFTNFSVSGLAVLGVITANPYVTSLLVLVFTFALCAYIFFGKKG